MKKQITITLTEEDAKDILESGGRVASVVTMNHILAQIRAQSEPSRQTVLQELWEPKDNEHCIFIGDKLGIHKNVSLPSNREFYKQSGYVFCPLNQPELAEEIVKVRKGLYRPTQQDIDEHIPFWLYDKRDGSIAKSSGYVVDDLRGAKWCIYFFTEKQRTNYIASQKPKVVHGESKEAPPIATINGVCIYLGEDGILRGKIC